MHIKSEGSGNIVLGMDREKFTKHICKPQKKCFFATNIWIKILINLTLLDISSLEISIIMLTIFFLAIFKPKIGKLIREIPKK